MPRARELVPALTTLGRSLRRRIGNQRLAERAERIVADRAPDERLALAHLLELAEQSPKLLKGVLADRAAAEDLIFCLGSSQIVGSGLAAAGPRWLDEFGAARSATSPVLLRAIRLDDGVGPETRAEAAARLGTFKRRVFLRIAIADLLDRMTVAETADAMSALADECIRGALASAIRLSGAPTGAERGFCVIAMGKLGAGELNLSSDIDLIYLHDPHGEPGEVETASRIGEVLTELLAAGCFRVDLRLRPGGRSSPLVTVYEGALSFYQNFGQTWERAALLRARPVAGALALGQRLLEELSHFIYRRYLDFDTLRQLRAMKGQIEEELRSHTMVSQNIKLGYGGIRELEFIVQSLILIYGGRDPRLRVRETLASLERLQSLGYLDGARARSLADAYAFLRDVEHKLQVAAGLQTHSLPPDDSGMRVLAARMGCGKRDEAAAKLSEKLAQYRDLVAMQFRETLAGGGERVLAHSSDAAHSAWRSALNPAESVPYLAELGFAGPAESAAHLRLLARGPSHSLASPRRRELLDRIGPQLLDEISTLPDPDLTLMNLAGFLAAVGARSSFVELLQEHPATRRVLLSLFASSRYLSTIFIRHPDMLDTLVRSDLARAHRDSAELGAELAELIAASGDLESKLDALRAFRHQEFLRIAIADLGGELDLRAVETELTDLAEAVLREALLLAQVEIAARFEIPAGLRIAAMAMGRLGAREMSYNSDLDLIFVYDDASERAGSGREIAARIAQRLIAILETRTHEGYAYKLDLRLRPSGNAGPLVTSLEGFREYHRQSSALWERQALVRARVVAGDPELGTALETARQEFVFGRGLSASEVAEIAAMRARMEREIGVENANRLNLKQGPGGLVDIEFLTQMMALRYGRERPELRVRDTLRLTQALGKLALISEADAAALERDYQFMSKLENRLRIETDQPAWAVPTDHQGLQPLARRMGFEGAQAPARMLVELEHCRARVREIFNRQFDRERLRPQ